MANKKRVTRKELLKKPDEFITFSTKLISFAKKYNKQVLYSVLGIVFIFSVFAGIRYFSDRAETRGFSLVYDLMLKYQTDKDDKDQAQAYENVKNEFEQILEEYSGKKAGKIANFLYADMCYNAGDFDKAVKLYEKSVKDFDSEPFYKNLALSSLGYACEGKNDYKTAVSYFKKIESSSDAVIKDDALMQLGTVYSITGEFDKKDDAFREIVVNYPDSFYSKLAKEKIN